jgi:hypothetical protein
MSLQDELQQIRTLLDGIDLMMTAGSATGTMPFVNDTLEERARNIREQLKSLSGEIALGIRAST